MDWQAAVAEGKPWNECRIEDPYAEVCGRLGLTWVDGVDGQAHVMQILAEPGHTNVVKLSEVLSQCRSC